MKLNIKAFETKEIEKHCDDFSSELKISNITILFNCDRPIAAHNERTGLLYELCEDFLKNCEPAWRLCIESIATSWLDSKPIKEGHCYKAVTSVWPEDLETVIHYEIKHELDKQKEFWSE